jgi:hypothetical protein
LSIAISTGRQSGQYVHSTGNVKVVA